MEQHVSDICNILTMVSRVHGEFRKITSRGGNEQKITIVVAELFKLLNSKGFITQDNINMDNSKQLREMTFLLITNTDMHFKYDIKEDNIIAKLSNKCPQLTECLLMDCIWGLGLDQFFCEAVSYTPPWFAERLIDAAIPSVKYLKPHSALARVQKLIEALFLQMCRLQIIQIDQLDRTVALKIFLEQLVVLLHNYITPDSSKMADWSQSELFKYMGYSIKHVLEIIKTCIQLFNKVPVCKMHTDHVIYMISINEQFKPPSTKHKKYEGQIYETLKLCMKSIFEAGLANLMSITLDIFISWYEIEYEDSKEPLQTVIAHLAYEVLEMMKLKEDFDHELKEKLQLIARKPKDLSEQIKAADIETVVKNARLKGKDQKLWFNKMIGITQFFKNEECLTVLRHNLVLVDYENMKIILRCAIELLTEDLQYNNDDFKETILLALKNVRPVSDQIKLVHMHFIVNGLGNLFQKSQFESVLIEVFNKTLVMDNHKVQEMLGLALQNPWMVYDKIIETCFKNIKQIDMMSELLKNFTPLGLLSYTKIDISAMISKEKNNQVENLFLQTLINKFNELDLKSDEKHSIVLFMKNITELYSLMEADILLTKFILPNIQSNLMKENYIKLEIMLDALKYICTHKNVTRHRAPMLVVMAQVLEYARWDLTNYSVQKVSTVTLTADIATSIMEDLFKIRSIEDNEVRWLQTKVAFRKPMNKYYFQNIWSIRPEEQTLEFGNYLSENLKSQTKEYKIAFLCEHLLRCTLSEATALASAITDIDVVCDALSLISTVVKQNGSSSALGCLLHCCTLLPSMIKEMMKNKESNQTDQLKMFQTITKLLSNLPEAVKEECCLAVVNILAALMTEVELAADIKQELSEVISSMGSPEAEGILLKKLYHVDNN